MRKSSAWSARLAATLAVAAVLLASIGDAQARGISRPAPIGSTQGPTPTCKGAACGTRAPVGARRHCERFGPWHGGFIACF